MGIFLLLISIIVFFTLLFWSIAQKKDQIKKIVPKHEHEFGNWIKVREGSIERTNFINMGIMQGVVEPPKSGAIGRYFEQERTCKTCGYIQIDRQETRIQGY